MSGNSRSFSNHYYAMRHGQSEANRAGIIVSDPATGITAYGLTETGERQALESARRLQPVPAKLRIYSSDFLRARETAGLVHSVIRAPDPIALTGLLRERFFGELEGGTDDAYQAVWSRDVLDPEQCEQGVESIASVVERLRELLELLEGEYQGNNILLVAHGDVLQILQTLFENIEPCRHRQLRQMQVAEIRRLN